MAQRPVAYQGVVVADRQEPEALPAPGEVGGRSGAAGAQLLLPLRLRADGLLPNGVAAPGELRERDR